MFRLARLSTVSLLVSLMVGCGVSSGQSHPETFVSEYRYWGEETNWGRSANDTWLDGSNWFDGVSHNPPSLPLAQGEPLDGNVNCSQEEVIYKVAFPGEGADKFVWDKEADYRELFLQTKQNAAGIIWEGKPTSDEARKLLSEPPYKERCGETMERDPSASLSPGMRAQFEKSYQAVGEALYSKRTDGVTWLDGSNWTDGVSHIPPSLPLKPGQRIADSGITCAQDEIVYMVAFPPDADLETWHNDPYARVIAKRWNIRYAEYIWGKYESSDLDEWLDRENRSRRCGAEMR